MLAVVSLLPAAWAVESQWVYRGTTGRLVYAPDAQGDRIPDFSDVGYRGGRALLPNVPTMIAIDPIAGDDTASIQAAINQVAALPLGSDGFRGAVMLGPGTYEISGQLKINASGIVLRGAGRDAGGTLLVATGTTQRELIQIAGAGSQSTTGSTRNMIDKVVPVGSRSFRVNSTAGFAVGDTVRVERPSPANWISDLGMDTIPPRSDGGTVVQWAPGSFNLRYDRIITRIEGDRVFVDAPLTNSFELQYGGGTIKKYDWAGRIENVGVENLRGESMFASATDEAHATDFVTIDKAQNVWVRGTASANFSGSAVQSNPGAKWVTVENAINETPKSLITGERRYTFDLSGQLELVTDSVANEGRHDFVNNSSRPAGPHVFHNSIANNALDEAGPHQRWATGTLFDNITIDGDQINARNRGNFGTGHGWAGANMVIWNSTAESFIVQNPPTAQNWLVGSTGALIDDQTFGPQPPGYVDSHNAPVDVDSLYEAQLEDAKDVTSFHWLGGADVWTNADAWGERLTPGVYRIENRDYLIGDIDDFTNDGPTSVDAAPVDPNWRAAIESTSMAPITGFDDVSGNRNVAFTFQHQLDSGERVVHGSLAIALKQSGGAATDDFLRLFDLTTAHKLTFDQLGWQAAVNPSDAHVGVVDLGAYTDQLQSGSINVQVSNDTAVDWALYSTTVAKAIGDATAASVVIDSGEAIVASDIGAVGELIVGGPTGGALTVTAGGRLVVVSDYAQSPEGLLTIHVGANGAGELSIGGDALIDGAVQLVMNEGYVASLGDAFTLLDVAGQLDGSFATTFVPQLGGALTWRLYQTAQSIEAIVVLAGDYNGDGVVDVADYTVWRDALGSTTNLAADGDGSGSVDPADYALWAASYGTTAASAGPARGVPEPLAIQFFATMLLAAVARRPSGCALRVDFRCPSHKVLS
ncbi:hypothetical protein Pla108_04020 [Botrimarina colliarenosi]|uniref:Probable pectate lyase C n=2 Tax=Botrimarina colliarenosi TaxID=2528001 RepID=A0A5C6AMR7_9BACT|nr:hypothetical protein Pla108_04020 [Botrimarina colliarenosi]